MYIQKATKEFDEIYGVPRRYYDFEYIPKDSTPQKIADDILKEISGELEIESDLSQLRFEQVKESIFGFHVLYQQQWFGKLVSGAWIRIDIDKKGSVFNIANDLVPVRIFKSNENTGQQPSLIIDKARKIATRVVTGSADTLVRFFNEELVCFLINDTPVIAWKLILKTADPITSWKVYIDAATEEVIEKIDLLKYLNGRGKVFKPNPFITLPIHPVNFPNIPATAYVNVDLPGLQNTGMLDGEFVSTNKTTDRVSNPQLEFIFNRDNHGFGEVMAYYYIDSVQRYIQELGFMNILNKPISVKVDGSDLSSSFYEPVEKIIVLGTGIINDAEDAEVIVHEYGHAMIENLLPNFGENNKEARAMEEGFGDYLAASFFEENKVPDDLKPTFGNWNKEALKNESSPPCIRRLDSIKQFTNSDLTGNAHQDCEIWSACLWQIRKKLTRKIADRLIIAHLRLLTKKDKFESAANRLITADKQLNKGVNGPALKEIFVSRKILAP